MELFWHNIQWVTVNIQLGRDLQIGPEGAGIDRGLTSFKNLPILREHKPQ